MTPRPMTTSTIPTMGASAAVSFVGTRRAVPRAHEPVRPGHIHHNPAGLPRRFCGGHIVRPWDGGSGRSHSGCSLQHGWTCTSSGCVLLRRDHREGPRGLACLPGDGAPAVLLPFCPGQLTLPVTCTTIHAQLSSCRRQKKSKCHRCRSVWNQQPPNPSSSQCATPEMMFSPTEQFATRVAMFSSAPDSGIC